MNKIVFVVIFFSFVQLDSISQEVYSISIDDRNAVIELTNEAINDMKNQKHDEAFQKLLNALQIDSTYRQTYQQLYQAGRLSSAKSEIIIRELNKGKRIFEEDDELNFYCGEIYRQMSDFDNAINEYTNAIKYSLINGEDFYLVSYYYSNRGICFQKKEQFDLAINDYNKLLKMDPESVSGLTNRGIIYFKMDHKEKACIDWKKAMENGSEYAKKYFDKYCQ